MKIAPKILLLIATILPVFLLAQLGEKSSISTDDSFDIFLILLATVVVCGMIGVTIAGAILTILFFTAICIFVALGIVSVSLLSGWYKKSITTGTKTFIAICSSAIGLCMGMVGVMLCKLLSTSNHVGNVAFLWGGMGGIIGGYFTGRIIINAIGITHHYIYRKLNRMT